MAQNNKTWTLSGFQEEFGTPALVDVNSPKHGTFTVLEFTDEFGTVTRVGVPQEGLTHEKLGRIFDFDKLVSVHKESPLHILEGTYTDRSKDKAGQTCFTLVVGTSAKRTKVDFSNL